MVFLIREPEGAVGRNQQGTEKESGTYMWTPVVNRLDQDTHSDRAMFRTPLRLLLLSVARVKFRTGLLTETKLKTWRRDTRRRRLSVHLDTALTHREPPLVSVSPLSVRESPLDSP